MTAASPKTLLDALQASMAAALRSRTAWLTRCAAMARRRRQWRHDPEPSKSDSSYTCRTLCAGRATRSVIWLRIVDRTLPDVSPALGVVPILYLPMSAGRNCVRGDCPTDLQP